ncbi:Dickkopf N-terminal cysteine-rich domain-containing protein [Chloroflexota bacterium]
MQYLLGARKADKRERTSSSLCSIDADCPPGYDCINGHCVPSQS